MRPESEGAILGKSAVEPSVTRLTPRSQYQLAVQLIQFAERQTHDLQSVLRACADLGIHRLEVNYGKLPSDVQEVARLCADAQLHIHSAHVSYREVAEDGQLKTILAALRTFGCGALICSGVADGPHVVALPKTANRFGAIARQCRQHDIQFLYHPYSEREGVEDLTTHLEQLIARTPNGGLMLAVDTFWCNDLLGLDARRRSRLLSHSNYFHLKDGYQDPSLDRPMFVPLGEGEMHVETWLAEIQQLSRSPLTLVIEQDTCATDPESELRRSVQFLSKRGIR